MRGQIALLAVSILSLAVLAYVYTLASMRVKIVYHGEAEWMLLLSTARHSLASGISLDVLMNRLKTVAADNSVWIPPVWWSVEYSSNSTGWTYKAVFYNDTLPGFQATFLASANYTLLGIETDDLGNEWLIYNLTYLHRYKIPQYSYFITIHPAPLNNTCARVYKTSNGWSVKITLNCSLTDKWNITVIKT